MGCRGCGCGFRVKRLGPRVQDARVYVYCKALGSFLTLEVRFRV